MFSLVYLYPRVTLPSGYAIDSSIENNNNSQCSRVTTVSVCRLLFQGVFWAVFCNAGSGMTRATPYLPICILNGGRSYERSGGGANEPAPPLIG